MSIAQQQFSSHYHPQSNGVIKNVHSSLKQMLAKVTTLFPEEWDRCLPTALFAYRELPQKSVRYLANEVVFGGPIRGPLSILRDIWIPPDVSEYKTYYTYITEVRKQIITGCKLARENLDKAGELQHLYCNKNRTLGMLKAKDDMFIMLPDKVNILSTSWQGPFKVIK